MSQPRRFLVIGSDGLIGRALSQRLAAGGAEVFGTTRRKSETSPRRLYFDLGEDLADWKLPEEFSSRDGSAGPGAIFCSAITNQQKCRQDTAATARINVSQTLLLSRRLAGQFGFVVFLSTNLVFDGKTPLAMENDPTNPQTEYGRQKTLVEQSLLSGGNHGQFPIVRLSKVFHTQMPLLLRWVVALHKGEVISPLSDLICSPVSLEFTVDALERIVRAPAPGIFQISGECDISYAEIAQRLARHMGVEADLVQPKSSRELGIDLEHIPLHTTMDTNRIVKELGLAPPPVWTMVDSVLKNILAA